MLLIYAGWGAAPFVTVILGGAAFAIDRFDLCTDDTSPLGATDEFPWSDRNADTPDR